MKTDPKRSAHRAVRPQRPEDAEAHHNRHQQHAHLQDNQSAAVTHEEESQKVYLGYVLRGRHQKEDIMYHAFAIIPNKELYMFLNETLHSPRHATLAEFLEELARLVRAYNLEITPRKRQSYYASSAAEGGYDFD